MAAQKAFQSKIFNVLSNETRLNILNWLKEPEANFGTQAVGSFVDDGVCVTLIQQKSKLTQSTTSTYLVQLLDAGLLTSKRVGQWTYYKRDEKAIKKFLNELASL
jgi:DNA-binding transcriptional ArsR family regulator